MVVNGRSPVSDMYTVTSSNMSDRVKAGMGPTTLLTEYRRKVILQAINNSGNIKDSVIESKKKVDLYTRSNYPHLVPHDDDKSMYMSKELNSFSSNDTQLFNTKKTKSVVWKKDVSVDSSTSNNSINKPQRNDASPSFSSNNLSKVCLFGNSVSDKSSISSTSTTTQDFPALRKTAFRSSNPKWENYDTMKSRWKEIRPSLLEEKAGKMEYSRIRSRAKSKAISRPSTQMKNYKDSYNRKSENGMSSSTYVTIDANAIGEERVEPCRQPIPVAVYARGQPWPHIASV